MIDRIAIGQSAVRTTDAVLAGLVRGRNPFSRTATTARYTGETAAAVRRLGGAEGVGRRELAGLQIAQNRR